MLQIDNHQISALEQDLGFALPGLYRKLLLELGYGNFAKGLQIYHPSEIRSLYEPFFDDPQQLFNPYFPFGCDNRNQDLWIIDSSTETAAAISHETHPDDWPDEEWLGYDHWIDRYLNSSLNC